MPPEGLETPAPETSVTPPNTPPATDVVPLSRKEYDDLIAMRTQAEGLQAQAEELRNVERATTVLLTPDAPPETQEAAMRFLMARRGYTPDQIETYVAQTRQPQEPPVEPEPRRRRSEPDPNLEGVDSKQVAALQQQLVEMRQSQLQRDLDNSVSAALDKHPKLGKLLADVRVEQGQTPEQAREETRRMLKNELLRDTLDRLRVRHSAQGKIGDGQIEMEASAAAEAVAKRYGRFDIGSTSRLGRAPEIESDEDLLLKAPAVKAPEYKPGMTSSEAKGTLVNWAKDHLMRGVAEESRGGKSQV